MGAAVLTTHSMDQLLEAFMCKKEFSVYFIFTLSLKILPFLSYDALRICFLTHLVPTVYMARDVMILMRAISITRVIGRGGP
jgi:hypothetical protein